MRLEPNLWMTVTTIFFDFGGTLAHPRPPLDVPERVWSDVGARIGVEVAESEAKAALEQAERRVGNRIYEYVGRIEDFWHLFDGVVMDQLQIHMRRAEIERAVQTIFDDPSNIELFPETVGVLGELRERGFRTGVISNHHDGLLRLLEYHHLSQLLDTVTYSQEVGVGKPAATIFTRALERARCAPAEAVNVGDSLEMDVYGALKAGLTAVWVNRRELPPVENIPSVCTLAELPPLLRRLTPPTR